MTLRYSFILILTQCCNMFSQPVNLRCEHKPNPTGIFQSSPRLSWALADTSYGTCQSAYQIVVADKPGLCTEKLANCWNSGRVQSSQSQLVPYKGKPLESGKKYYWKIRYWNQQKKASPFSELATWDMALLSPLDWKADWIGLDQEGYPQRSITLRKEFLVKKELTSAKTYVTGLGGYVLFINGEKVSDDLLTPGWTVFRKRIPYQTYDVTKYMKKGANAFGAVLGNNWWAGILHGQSSFVHYSGEPLRFMMQTIMSYADGTSDTLITGNGWKAKIAPLVMNINEKELPAIGSDYFFTGTGQPGLTAEIFDNALVEGKPKVTLTDTLIDFNFEGHSPDGAIGDDNFSIRWSGYLQVPETKSYKLVTWSDDGVRLYLDGKKVIDNWTSHALQIDTFTVFLEKGARHKIVLEYFDSHYGAIIKLGWNHLDDKFLAARRQLKEKAKYPADGSVPFSPVIKNSIYEGETYDARLEEKGWAEAGFNDSHWREVRKFRDPGKELLFPSQTNPIRVSQELPSTSFHEIRPGMYVFDFGQNMAGAARLKVRGNRGDTIRIRFGELLNQDGSVNQLNLGVATSTDVYILKGDTSETWAPNFTYHGFRYAEVTGLRYVPYSSTLTALVFHNSDKTVQQFTSSNPLFNKIAEALLWSQRSNTMEVPTDSPNRDERLGWLGDEQAYAGAAPYLMDRSVLYTKWMQDMADELTPDSLIHVVAPNTSFTTMAPLTWSIACVVVPYQVFRFYGDTLLLRNHYITMKKWFEKFVSFSAGGFIHDPAIVRGDYLAPVATDPMVVTNAYYYLAASLMANMAALNGDKTAVDRYTHLAQAIRDTFNLKLLNTSTGNYGKGDQSSHVLPLAFGLVPEHLRQKVADNLADSVKVNGYRLTTGFFGTAFLLSTLCENGHPETAYRMATGKQYPSWGHQIESGATTFWERWNSDAERLDGMNSYNHVGYGIGEWLFGYLAGIRPLDSIPGMKAFLVAPCFPEKENMASSCFETGYGTIRVKWERKTDGIHLLVKVPANTKALLQLPVMAGGSLKKVTWANQEIFPEYNRSPWIQPFPKGKDQNRSSFTLSSGTHQLVIRYE